MVLIEDSACSGDNSDVQNLDEAQLACIRKLVEAK